MDTIDTAVYRAGAYAHEVGVSFDQFVSIVEHVHKVTGRSYSVIGNALKTIFCRLAREGTTDGLATLRSIAEGYNNLSKEEKNHTAVRLGGVYQVNVAKVLVGTRFLLT